MITENLSTLKINKLTQEQYDRAVSEGRIEINELYLTPDTSVTNEQLNAKADKSHNHDDKYYTEAEINAKFAEINQAIEDIVVGSGEDIVLGIYETKTDAEAKLDAAKAYTDTAVGGKVSKSGDTMTGKLTAPIFETGSADANYFQCRKFRGEGDASTYYHAIDFGHSGNDKFNFYEFGGEFNFYKCRGGTKDGAELIGSITSEGFIGNASTATKASQDAAGNLITTTYETKDDALMKFSEAKEYVFECIDSLQADIASGAVTVAYADKSECDWEGNVISSTYETKTDATSKLTEAKEYVDTAVAGKADSEHNHNNLYYSIATIDNKFTQINNSITGIVGGASEDYNTLKKIEDKIKNISFDSSYATQDYVDDAIRLAISGAIGGSY